MTETVFAIGLPAGGTLIALLLLTLRSSTFRIWPTPGPGTWQSYVFWWLFRGLNALCVVVAILDMPGRFLGLPEWLRGAGFVALIVSVSLFVYAFRVLGRDNSYGAREGLVTDGIYEWSRNPQNAMLMVVYGCLAIAADSGPTYVLCTAMIAVYALMVLAEEPWLDAIYGEPYRAYCARVPRFFNWRRAVAPA